MGIVASNLSYGRVTPTANLALFYDAKNPASYPNTGVWNPILGVGSSITTDATSNNGYLTFKSTAQEIPDASLNTATAVTWVVSYKPSSISNGTLFAVRSSNSTQYSASGLSAVDVPTLGTNALLSSADLGQTYGVANSMMTSDAPTVYDTVGTTTVTQQVVYTPASTLMTVDVPTLGTNALLATANVGIAWSVVDPMATSQSDLNISGTTAHNTQLQSDWPYAEMSARIDDGGSGIVVRLNDGDKNVPLSVGFNTNTTNPGDNESEVVVIVFKKSASNISNIQIYRNGMLAASSPSSNSIQNFPSSTPIQLFYKDGGADINMNSPVRAVLMYKRELQMDEIATVTQTFK